MKYALLNRCTGGNAAYEAMHTHPELFENIKCFLAYELMYDGYDEKIAGYAGVDKYMELMLLNN